MEIPRRVIGEPGLPAAIGIHDVDFIITVAAAHKRDSGAVGGPDQVVLHSDNGSPMKGATMLADVTLVVA